MIITVEGIFLIEKHFSQAVSAIELVILLEGENSENLFNLGVATMCAGELEQAVGFYQKAFEICDDKLRKNQIEKVLGQVRVELGMT